ncbi:hypothetical protein F2P56_008508 [Juglans regia]|uniref:Reverse transcriptase domain-containing protein n=1 Tax=Juglans regia TaxID=51240 RepID=A0A833XWM6_JUGRE|nr:hypothetical protein F2P56_008508 [Juglans regia]
MDMNKKLGIKYTAGEVKEALFQMNPLGSLGPNGFPIDFYQVHWEIVGDKVTQAVLEVLNSEGDISYINNTYIVLIPKVKCPKFVLDFQPISLCNVLYKVVSKVLANRLKKILPQIISPTQSAFVSGRLILDNVIVAFEAMHSMSIRNRREQEVLSNLLNHAESVKSIHGFPIGRGQIIINHLFFADDRLLFYRANVEELATISTLLSLYEGASEQELNKDKTAIYFSAKTRQEAREFILRIAGTRATSCYERYLGLPALVGRLKHSAFKSLLDKVRSKEKESKVHWVSWSHMGKAKEAGGMGFREFESFNLALLAKQDWRANLGARLSFIWRSFLAARNLIVKGSMWRIGSGQETRIWKDRWLPRPSTFMVQCQGQDIDEEAKVAELIQEDTKQWDREKILSMLGPVNAAII